MTTSAEEQLISKLQKRLHTSGPLPKREIVCAAVALARNPKLSIAAACDSQKPKVARGSRDRVKSFRDTINKERLLHAACAPWKPPPPPPPLPPLPEAFDSQEWRTRKCERLWLHNDVDAELNAGREDLGIPEGYTIASEIRTAKALLLPCHQPDPMQMHAIVDPDDYFSRLLVPRDWITSNATNIWWLNVCPLCVSEDGTFATRQLAARLKVPPEKRFLDIKDHDEWYDAVLDESDQQDDAGRGLSLPRARFHARDMA